MIELKLAITSFNSSIDLNKMMMELQFGEQCHACPPLYSTPTILGDDRAQSR